MDNARARARAHSFPAGSATATGGEDMNQSKVSFGDRLRIELAILRIDWELDGRIPWRGRRRRKKQPRGNLLAAAQSKGAIAAASPPGGPRAPRASYLEGVRGRPAARRG